MTETEEEALEAEYLAALSEWRAAKEAREKSWKPSPEGYSLEASEALLRAEKRYEAAARAWAAYNAENLARACLAEKEAIAAYKEVERAEEKERDRINSEIRRASGARRRELDAEMAASDARVDAAFAAAIKAKKEYAALRNRVGVVERPIPFKSDLRAWQEKEEAIKNLVELYKQGLD